MPPKRTSFVCQSCGHASPKWLGRCPECSEWGSLAEENCALRRARSFQQSGAVVGPALCDVAEDEQVTRFQSGLELLDRVLGGGVVSGAAALLAGEPGIGKSTLLLQLGNALANRGISVLYASAEESPRQLRMRAERLRCDSPRLLVAGETELEPLLAAVEDSAPQVVLVDSVQALRSRELESPPGSIGQVRFAAGGLVDLCKRQHRALFLVGHVTKEGSIAGPKSLEHLVDTVLTFEGETHSEYRILRAQKNRFGPTGEVAMFEMHDSGLVEVADPSRVLLALRAATIPARWSRQACTVRVRCWSRCSAWSTRRASLHLGA